MGKCGSTISKKSQILLAGIENSGKTFFLFSHGKNFISSGTANKIRTKPTDCNFL